MHSTLSLRPLADDYIRGRLKRGEITRGTAKSNAWVLRTLARSYGNRPPSNLSRKAIERWLEDINHLAPSARRGALSVVRGFVRWLVDEGEIAEDPTAKIPRIRTPRPTPRAVAVRDVEAVFTVCPDQRARVIVALMVGCGLRCKEVAGLSVRDWDPDAATIRVVGKGGHPRELPVPRFVTDELDAYVQGRGPLVRRHDKPWRGLSADTISTYTSGLFRQAGIKQYPYDGRSAHALRHTAASDVLDNCGDLRVVQEMLGHANIATTSVYLRRAALGQMREAMENRNYGANAPPLLRAA